MKADHITLYRSGPAFYLPKLLQMGRTQTTGQRQNLHHPSYKFFLQEGTVEDKV